MGKIKLFTKQFRQNIRKIQPKNLLITRLLRRQQLLVAQERFDYQQLNHILFLEPHDSKLATHTSKTAKNTNFFIFK